ncbi:MAG TPA: hypothetical protein VHH73_18365 [Verrucomicrobiae bacterium]|nr:hypothetical protein [Verrucomicrobiae bacterium]
MLSNTFDRHVKFNQIFWFGVIGVVCLALGYLLAWASWMVFMTAAAGFWLITLPYHSRIATYLSVATFTSALILPYFPGRPYMWEFAGLLGWTGMIVTVSLRQYSPNFAKLVQANIWLFLGLAGYCAVLLVTMFYRGIGFRLLGNELMGGRFYFQQLICSIFPLLFTMVTLEEKMVSRLFFAQCILTSTYLVSDFIFSIAPQALIFLLQFFELPGDALNFEGLARSHGIRRFQSLYIVGTGVIYVLMARFPLSEFFGFRGLVLLPVSLGVFGIGLLSGHRFLFFIVSMVGLQVAFTQRFINFKNAMVGLVMLGTGLFFAYGYADQMPLAAQRALAVLPGIQVQSDARADGLATLDGRAMLRSIGWKMAPDYFWIGRGFGQFSSDYSLYWDPSGINYHLNQGRFFNGFIGLLVNTGFFGTLFMLMFLASGSWLSVKIMARVRRFRYEDVFSRVSSLLAGLWVANVISFLFLHGDSEYAMKTFSLQAGLLITCNHLLAQRESQPAEVPLASEPASLTAPVADPSPA